MKEIIDSIITFRNSRGWRMTDKPNDLVKSIFIEAAELLENFQWQSQGFDESNVKEEIADILMYTLALANDLNLDVQQIILEKIEKNKKKYPEISKKKV